MNTTVLIDPTILQITLGVILPMVVALVTRRFTDGSVKAITLLGLSTLSGVLTQVAADGGSFAFWPTVLAAMETFAMGVLAHYGLWKPIQVTGDDGVINRLVPGGLVGTPKPDDA